MSQTFRILGLIAACAALSGCDDNVTCVFTSGCQGGSGAISDNEALLPVDGEWIVDGPPEVTDFFPSGTDNIGTTPIVIVFSETIQEQSLTNSLLIVPLIGGLPDVPIVGVQQALVCQGRVLLLLPPTKLDTGDYIVRLTDQATVLDLTGQLLAEDEGAQLGTFSITDPGPLAPRVVTSFPKNNTSNQGETTQIVVVFDRPVVPTTVNATSFDVRVEGVPPLNDPPAVPVQTVIADPRAFLYRSVDPTGRPVPLGTDVDVEVRLSPATDPISETDGGKLPPITLSFHTLTFAPPLGASLLSKPTDAIGLANLTDGNAEELTVQVDLDDAQPNDSVDLILFGDQKTTEANPPLIALQRAVRLSGTAPITSALFLREDVGLQISSAPDDVRFEDGPVTFAFRSRRGNVVTPLRLLDLDPDPDTIQDPLLDTAVPDVDSLVGSTGTDLFRSDLRDLSLAGITTDNDKLRSVEVTTPLGNNGPLAPVVGAGDNAGGAFLAAPVPVGVVAGGSTTYAFVARDEAQNAGPSLPGAFTQVGVLGPAPLVLGSPIDVEVFDSRTLAPLAGALVLVHSDLGNGTFPLVQSATTLLDGKVSVATAGAPAVAAVLTVVRPGYDLFTLHGVPTAHVSVPLDPSAVPVARVSGAARTTDAGAAAFLNALDRRYDDTRRLVELPRGFPGVSCGSGGGALNCGFGPAAIRDERLGACSFFAGDFLQTEAAFNPTQLLRAFALSVPLAPVEAGDAQLASLEVPFLLDDPSVPAEEIVQTVPVFTFRLDVASGVDTNNLEDDAATSGELFADVEVLVPGLNGAIAVAQALSYDQTGNRWTVRGAFPGAITAAGSLGSNDVVDTDPFVRVEIEDDDGNAAGVRPRLSTLQAAGPNPELRALSVPTQLAPASAAHTGGQAFTLALTHVIGDERAENQKGLYKVVLLDDEGRRWTLWRFDPSGAADVAIRAIDVADAGGIGLSDGNLVTSVSAYAWSSLSPTDFLWSDVEREFELFARAAPFSFAKP